MLNDSVVNEEGISITSHLHMHDSGKQGPYFPSGGSESTRVHTHTHTGFSDGALWRLGPRAWTHLLPPAGHPVVVRLVALGGELIHLHNLEH